MSDNSDLSESSSRKAASSSKKTKPRGLRRDRDCFTCKKRNVKCDLNRPACGQCIQDSQHCGGYPSRVKWNNPVLQKEVKAAASAATRASNSKRNQELPVLGDPCPEQSSLDPLPMTIKLEPPDASYQSPSEHSGLSDPSPQGRSPDEDLGLLMTEPPFVSVNGIPGFLNDNTLPISNFVPQSYFDDDTELNRITGLCQIIDPLQATTFVFMMKALLATFNRLVVLHDNFVDVQARRKAMIAIITDYLLATVNFQAGKKEAAFAQRAAAIRQLLFVEPVLEVNFCLAAIASFDVLVWFPFGDWQEACVKYSRKILDQYFPDKESLLLAYKSIPGLQTAVSVLVWIDAAKSITDLSTDNMVFETWHLETVSDQVFSSAGVSRQHMQEIIVCLNPASSLDTFFKSMSNVLAFARVGDWNTALFSTVVQAIWCYAEALAGMAVKFREYGINSLMSRIVDQACFLVCLLPMDSPLSQHVAIPLFVASRFAVREEQRKIFIDYWSHWNQGSSYFTGSLDSIRQLWSELDIKRANSVANGSEQALGRTFNIPSTAEAWF